MGLGGRLALIFIALVAVTAVAIGAASVVTTDRQVTAEVDQFLRGRADEIADGQRSQPSGRNERGRDAQPAAPLSVEPDTIVQLLDDDGAITAGSGSALPVSASDVELAERNGSSTLRTVVIDGVDHRMVTTHVSGGGAVQVARSLDETNTLIGVLQIRLAVIAAVMAVVAGLLGWMVARRMTRPLRSLTRAVDRVAETRDFSIPVDAEGTDEVARLAGGFDRMLQALEVSRAQQHRLVQDAAHELRTPLTSIKANVDWLAHADRVDPATRTETLVGVQAELTELDGLIAEIIELATDRHALPPFQPIDLSDVAHDAVERFRLRSSRPVRLDSEPSRVSGDADALRRAITNLLTNAEKYSPDGAPIAVEVRAGGVWVSDQGAGIPQVDRERIFDRFYRRESDRSRPGSGLGLAIVAEIVRAHDGTVHVDDAAGGGARVGFALPVSEL